MKTFQQWLEGYDPLDGVKQVLSQIYQESSEIATGKRRTIDSRLLVSLKKEVLSSGFDLPEVEDMIDNVNNYLPIQPEPFPNFNKNMLAKLTSIIQSLQHAKEKESSFGGEEE